MAGGGAAKQADAFDGGAARRKAPHAHPFDPERRGGDFENVAQPILEPVVRVGVSRGERRQGAALRGEALFAFLERPLRAQLLADVVEDRQHGGLVLPRHQPGRRPGPEGAALRMPQLEQHVIGGAAALERLGQLLAVRRVDVIVGGEEPDGLGMRHAEHFGGPLVDGEDGLVAQPADDRRERADIEELLEERCGHHGVRRFARPTSAASSPYLRESAEVKFPGERRAISGNWPPVAIVPAVDTAPPGGRGWRGARALAGRARLSGRWSAASINGSASESRALRHQRGAEQAFRLRDPPVAGGVQAPAHLQRVTHDGFGCGAPAALRSGRAPGRAQCSTTRG